MNYSLPLAALFAAACSLPAQATPVNAQPADASHFRVLSPDKMTFLDVCLDDGRLTYTAGYRQLVKAKKKDAAPDTIDVPVLEPSPLGVKTDIADFSKDLTLVGPSPPAITYAKASRARSACRTMTSTFSSPLPPPEGAK